MKRKELIFLCKYIKNESLISSLTTLFFLFAFAFYYILLNGLYVDYSLYITIIFAIAMIEIPLGFYILHTLEKDNEILKQLERK